MDKGQLLELQFKIQVHFLDAIQSGAKNPTSYPDYYDVRE